MFGLNRTGVRATGREEHGVFDLELRFDTDTQKAQMSIGGLEITGAPPTSVLGGLRFLAGFRTPNALRFALPHGPATDAGIPIPADPPEPDDAATVLRIVEALATIQEHTPVQLTVPDFTETTRRQASDIISAARLLRGETLSGTWNKRQLRVDPTTITTDVPLSVMSIESFTVTVGDTDIDLGQLQVRLLAVTVELDPDVAPDGDGLVPAQFHPYEGNRDLLLWRLPENENSL